MVLAPPQAKLWRMQPVPESHSAISVPGNEGIKIVRSCTIRRSAPDLYAFWRDFTNLARIIRHPVTIAVAGDGQESGWAVSAPFKSGKLNWRATIINDKPPGLIAWRSLEGADVPNAGSVRFEPAPGDEGTEVTVSLEYDPPGGKLAGLFTKLSPEDPGRQVADTLRRFKALMEAGEIPTIEGQSAGKPQREARA